MVLGLTITFTVTIVGIAKVVGGVGLGSDPLRDVAVVVLLAVGRGAARAGVSAIAWRRRSRGWPRSGRARRGDGFRSGLLVGAALGFVYTPCAGPILAAVISVSAASGRTSRWRSPTRSARRSCCSALTLGGRALFDRVRRAGRGPLLQRTLGAIMILTALAIVTNLDVRFDQHVAQHIPDVNLTATPREIARRRKPPARDHRPQSEVQARAASAATPTAVAAHDASQARLLATPRGLPTSARRRNSPKPRTGSTRPGESRR